MVWYKRSKLVFDICRNMAAMGSNHLAKSPSLSRKFLGQWTGKSAFSSGPRFVHRAPNIAKVHPHSSKTNRDAKGCFFVGALGVVGITICSLEQVPYSDRYHVVFMPRFLERKLGEFQANKIKEEFKSDVLSAQHPLSVRVSAITKTMIEARVPHGIDPLGFLLMSQRRCSLTERFPEYRDWEVTVIDKPIDKAYCYAAGKIVIFTGLLNRLKSDAEIAAVIGHEIGHDVARHAGERITTLPLITCLKPITWLFSKVFGITDDPKLFFLRKQEIEADNIGLRLMACGGYDPSIAPNVYKRLSRNRVANDSCLSFPTGSERADLLSQSELMEEAKSMYKRAMAGDWDGEIERFIFGLFFIIFFPVSIPIFMAMHLWALVMEMAIPLTFLVLFLVIALF